jgi:type I restriction enzyme R subunit
VSPAGYTEDALVEQPALGLLRELGWETVDAYHEFDNGPSVLGRETRSEVILKNRLRPALQRLNQDASPMAIDQVIEQLTRDRSRMSPVAANREIYDLLKNGGRARIPDPDGNGETTETVRVIDWNEPMSNNFLFCSQFWVTGDMYTRRADLVGFVNGLPLVFIELKAAHRRLETAFHNNLRDYKDTIPQLFWPNALIILSNGSESRVGSMTAGWEHFAEWKKISDEEEPGRVSLETMLRGLGEPTRLLDLVENFTLFQEVRGGLIKLLAKNHQYLGVNNALKALADSHRKKGKLGVFWHTQGSGKSVSMMFFSQKVFRKLPGNWTFVVVTDRQELDGQIYKNFSSAGIVTEAHAQATSCRHLQQLLTEDHRYVFTLIHKFRPDEGGQQPELSDRSDIVVITDEAHRSQYDMLALNMRLALPHASFLAFTGTPLIVGEEKTRQVFGDYISVYDFQQSVVDGATVPLYYENRIPELQLANENLNKDMEELLEQAELDEDQEKALEREFSHEYHLITRDDRLEAVAKDLVAHFVGRGFQGKAMVVSIDKATAVRMYDKVKRHWTLKLAELRADRDRLDGPAREEIEERISLMKETDMAVVVSQGQNEIADMAARGLDIRPHRRRIIDEDLEAKFKDPMDPFRIVFVCAMWMTGFDVPNCSTIYLDKPMRNHTLMQTIARANRVYPGKVNGLIVDYVGVFRNLEAALAIYGTGRGGDRPVEDKATLVAALRQALAEARHFCDERGVNIATIQAAEGFTRISLLDDGVEALVDSEDTKRRYLDLANTVLRLFRAVLPDPAAREFGVEASPIVILADKIRALVPKADISDMMEKVDDLLDDSVTAEGYIVREREAGGSSYTTDLSAINFEELAARFAVGHKRTINEALKGTVAQRLAAMVRLNRMRMDYLEQFQKMIDEYNAGSVNAEEFFRQLGVFSKSLTAEEQRGVSEQLSEEELAVFDLLMKPQVEMSAADRERVKVTARKLLKTLKDAKLVLDWRKRQQARADVQVTIEKVLDQGLPKAYTPELFEQKSAAVFQHVYDAYYGAGRSIYATQ